MEHSIGTGMLVGVVITIGILVYNSKYFTSTQKKIIIPLLIFPPAGIVSLIIIWISNEIKKGSEKVNQFKKNKNIEQIKESSQYNYENMQANNSNDEKLTLQSRIKELNDSNQLIIER